MQIAICHKIDSINAQCIDLYKSVFTEYEYSSNLKKPIHKLWSIWRSWSIIDICIFHINFITIPIVSFAIPPPRVCAVGIVFVFLHWILTFGAASLLHQAPVGPAHVDASYQSEDHWDGGKAKEYEEITRAWNAKKCFVFKSVNEWKYASWVHFEET